MKKGMQKGGQVTIFVLIAILIVSAVLIFFLWQGPAVQTALTGELGFEKCIEDVVEQAVDELERKAGFINPQFTYQYNGEEFTYLCYTNQYYETCTVQAPFLKNLFDEQIELLTKEKISTCYSNSIDSLKAQGYSVTPGNLEYDILIEPSVIRVEVEAPTVIGSRSVARFNIKVNSPLYEALMISTSILQSETRYGDANTDPIMLFYPEYMVKKLKRSDSTTIYIVENRVTGNKFQFASRSLAWPAGYNL